MSEEQLSSVAAMSAQALVVSPDQVRLADGGGGLELAQVVGPAFPAELAHARSDRVIRIPLLSGPICQRQN
jgi:hypothetical protein